MVEKYKVCKGTGMLVTTDTKECPVTKSNEFVDKYKGTAVILNCKESEVAKKINAEHNGKYALKY